MSVMRFVALLQIVCRSLPALLQIVKRRVTVRIVMGGRIAGRGRFLDLVRIPPLILTSCPQGSEALMLSKPLDRRRLLASLTSGLAWSAAPRSLFAVPQASTPVPQAPHAAPPLRGPDGAVDWRAVRGLFPLAKDRLHFASFLFVSHPAPVAAAIEHFRRKLDEDPTYIDAIAFEPDSKERPFTDVKKALADYVGGLPEEICLTSNTTSALAMAYQALRIRSDQEVVTTEHDHYSHHEAIRLASERSGAAVRRVSLYDEAANARADEVVARLARAITPKTRAVGVIRRKKSSRCRTPSESRASCGPPSRSATAARSSKGSRCGSRKAGSSRPRPNGARRCCVSSWRPTPALPARRAGAGRPHTPVAQSGLLFYNTLFDENAASHVAVGAAYKFTLADAQSMDDEAFERAGGNRSGVHVDLMIGSSEVDVDGIQQNGVAEPLMRRGRMG